MNNKKLAISYLKDAEIIFEEAKESFRKKHWHRVVRKAQEASELAGKALLIYLGVEYPKKHFIGKIIEKLDLENKIILAYYLDSLASEREKALYGTKFEAASEIFSEDDAKNALEKCEWVINYIKRFLEKSQKIDSSSISKAVKIFII